MSSFEGNHLLKLLTLAIVPEWSKGADLRSAIIFEAAKAGNVRGFEPLSVHFFWLEGKGALET